MKRLVIWGGRQGMDSFRHIQRAYYQNAMKLGIDAIWCDDDPSSGQALKTGDTVIAVDVWNKHLPYKQGIDYVIHNFDATHPVCLGDPENVLRLQVWTTEAFGEEWDKNRQYSREHRILFQPWGTDLLEGEFKSPIFNPNTNVVVFIGAVWSDNKRGEELGNEQSIDDVKSYCFEHGYNLRLLTQIPEQQMIDETRAACLAPTVVGGWQAHKGYLPCRAFKNVSYGVPVITNSFYVADLFNRAHTGGTVEMMNDGLELNKNDYLERTREDQLVAARYTYKQSLESIERALEEGRA